MNMIIPIASFPGSGIELLYSSCPEVSYLIKRGHQLFPPLRRMSLDLSVSSLYQVAHLGMDSTSSVFVNVLSARGASTKLFFFAQNIPFFPTVSRFDSTRLIVSSYKTRTAANPLSFTFHTLIIYIINMPPVNRRRGSQPLHLNPATQLLLGISTL